MADSSEVAEGWYRDPYGIHQDRWFSDGTPTSLVRDQGVEGRDDPPGFPPPMPPAEIPEHDEFPGDYFRRADEAEEHAADYDLGRAAEGAADGTATGFSGYDAS